MKYAGLVLSAGMIVLLTGCKEKPAPESSRPESPPASPAAAEVPRASPAFAVPDTFKTALGNVFAGYAEMQAALAQDDLAKAKAGFESMHVILHMMPKDGLDSAAKAYWDSTDAHIMNALHPLATATEIGPVREHFKDFSDILIDAIAKFGIGGSDSVHLFHCPMADGNRGADWLQKDKALRNPYFGKSMQTCGNLVKTLKG